MPHVAVANAAVREALRMADTAAAMIDGVLRTDDRLWIRETRAMDDVLGRPHDATKRISPALRGRGAGNPPTPAASVDVLAFAINLEHVGDIVGRNLLEAARRKIRRKPKFLQEGAADLLGILERLKKTQELAAMVFVSGDRCAARTLMKEKERSVRGRALEARATEATSRGCAPGGAKASRPSALQLDILRDLRRINAHLVTAAYLVLDLLPSQV